MIVGIEPGWRDGSIFPCISDFNLNVKAYAGADAVRGPEGSAWLWISMTMVIARKTFPPLYFLQFTICHGSNHCCLYTIDKICVIAHINCVGKNTMQIKILSLVDISMFLYTSASIFFISWMKFSTGCEMTTSKADLGSETRLGAYQVGLESILIAFFTTSLPCHSSENTTHDSFSFRIRRYLIYITKK